MSPASSAHHWRKVSVHVVGKHCGRPGMHGCLGSNSWNVSPPPCAYHNAAPGVHARVLYGYGVIQPAAMELPADHTIAGMGDSADHTLQAKKLS